MSFFGGKKPVQKRKFVGMSQKSAIPEILRKPSEPTKPTEPVKTRSNLFQPLQPYLAVVKDDIKRVLCIDEKSRKRRMDYEDFMEQHFGMLRRKKQ